MLHLDVAVPGGTLSARVDGPDAGPRMLMLHGGPGLSDSYLDGLIAEFSDVYRVATYAQRGVPPSTAGAPFDLATQADDAVAVIDALGWNHPTVLGHSWGGHLLLHVLAGHADRIGAAIALDPLGGVGDGGADAFGAAITARLPEDQRDLLDDERLTADERLRIVWPSYFPPGAAVPPYIPVELSTAPFEQGWAALDEALPALAPRLAGLVVPTLFLAGDGSPVPNSASVDTAAAIGRTATVRIMPGVGHFPWLEQRGVVRTEVDRFLSTPGSAAR